MKCSPYRKRYILIKGARNDLNMAVRDIYREFGAKEKYRDENYSIVLGNQFSKEYILSYARRKLKSVSVLRVSGTIKKCKDIIKNQER